MLKESIHIVVDEERLSDIEDAIRNLTEMFREQLHVKQQAIGDWIDEETVKNRCGLGRSTLLKLRNSGKLSSSTLSSKKRYYRLSEIERLLEENATNVIK